MSVQGRYSQPVGLAVDERCRMGNPGAMEIACRRFVRSFAPGHQALISACQRLTAARTVPMSKGCPIWILCRTVAKVILAIEVFFSCA